MTGWFSGVSCAGREGGCVGYPGMEVGATLQGGCSPGGSALPCVSLGDVWGDVVGDVESEVVGEEAADEDAEVEGGVRSWGERGPCLRPSSTLSADGRESSVPAFVQGLGCRANVNVEHVNTGDVIDGGINAGDEHSAGEAAAMAKRGRARVHRHTSGTCTHQHHGREAECAQVTYGGYTQARKAANLPRTWLKLLPLAVTDHRCIAVTSTTPTHTQPITPTSIHYSPKDRPGVPPLHHRHHRHCHHRHRLQPTHPQSCSCCWRCGGWPPSALTGCCVWCSQPCV